MNRLGKSLITDSELLSLDRIVAEIDAVEAIVGVRARCGAARVRPALGGVHRPERGAVPRGARADHARPRARGVNVLLNGRGGKVGSVLAPALEAAGHVLVDELADAEAMVDFTDKVTAINQPVMSPQFPVAATVTSRDGKKLSLVALPRPRRHRRHRHAPMGSDRPPSRATWNG